MRVLLYTRHNTTKWIRHIAANLSFASKTVVMSELRNEGDLSINNDFYRYIRKSGIGEKALTQFGEDGCDDIIARCRLLRSLPKIQARKMIGAAWQACRSLIDKVDPDLFVGLRMDSYVLDVIERILADRGVRYIGLWRAAVVPNMIFFTSRGEYIPLREPTEEEIEQCIFNVTASEFKATSLKKNVRYDFWTFFKKYMYHFLRDSFFEVQRKLVRDPLGYRYLTTGRHAKEYQVGLKDWRVVKYMRLDWRELFDSTPFEKRVFIGLQVNPEATIDYYVKNLELIKYQDVLLRMVKVLTEAGYRIFIKDHPNMFGMRRIQLYQSLADFDSLIWVPYQIPSQELISGSKIIYTWTGTIGLQAAMAGRCAIVVNPTYFIPGLFLQIKTLADIDHLPDRIESFKFPSDLNQTRERIARQILSSFVPGAMNMIEFSRDEPDAVNGANELILSLNSYLPQFARRA